MRKYLTLALLPAGLAIASLAFAGPSTTAQPDPDAHASATMPSSQITDAQLLKFDRAVMAARKVHKQYEPKMKAAKTDAEKSQIRQQEKQAAETAISRYMPVSQFMQIRHQVRNDPALKARAEKVAREARHHHKHHTMSPHTSTK